MRGAGLASHKRDLGVVAGHRKPRAAHQRVLPHDERTVRRTGYPLPGF